MRRALGLVPLDKLAQAPVSKATEVWDNTNMEKEQLYLVWVSPTKTVPFRSYERAWRLSQKIFENSGRAVFVEVVK